MVTDETRHNSSEIIRTVNPPTLVLWWPFI
jgi:hypothetical protein